MYFSSRSKVNIVLTFVLVFSASFVLLVSASSRAQATKASSSQVDWPIFGYDLQHTHYNPNENVLDTTNVSNLTLDWQAATSGAIERISSPIIANGIVYIGDDTDTLYTYDANTGNSLWNYPVGNDGFWPSLTVVNGVAYVVDHSGHLAALDAKTGSQIWTTTISGSANSSPAVVNNIIYVNLFNTGLAAFNTTDGSLLWSKNFSNCGSGSPAIANGIVYVTTINCDNNLYALDAQTGNTLWSGGIAIGQGGANGAAVSNGIVYVNAYTQDAVGAHTNLYAFNASGCGSATCSPLWVVPDGGPSLNLLPTPAIANGVVYIGSSSNGAATMYAFDANTGATLWTWTDPITGSGFNSSAAVANGVVYDATTNGNAYAFSAAGCGSSTCSPLWTYNMGNMIGTQSSPAVVNGMVYIGAYNTSISPSTGILFAFSLPGTTPTPTPTPTFTPTPSPSPTTSSLKLPWDSSLKTIYLSGGPHVFPTITDCNLQAVSRMSAVDFGMPTGTDVLAIADGTVVFAGNLGGQLRNVVAINHGGGFASEYWHLESIDPSIVPGVHVNQGKLLGKSGGTFKADGKTAIPHLHLDFYQYPFPNGDSDPINANHIQADGLTINGYTIHALDSTVIAPGDAYNYHGTMTRGPVQSTLLTNYCAGIHFNHVVYKQGDSAQETVASPGGFTSEAGNSSETLTSTNVELP
jgi:outer membrane protein assembly factor BamB